MKNCTHTKTVRLRLLLESYYFDENVLQHIIIGIHGSHENSRELAYVLIRSDPTTTLR